MERAEIYRRAAELIYLGRSNRACLAIEDAQYGEDSVFMKTPARLAYVDSILDGCEYSYRLYPRYCDGPKAMRARMTALCFAAAMASTGDL